MFVLIIDANETKVLYTLYFLLIIIALMIAVSVYYYLIKYTAKQKDLSPFYVTNNELIIIYYEIKK